MRPHAHLPPEAEQLALLLDEARRFRRTYVVLWTILMLGFDALLCVLWMVLH